MWRRKRTATVGESRDRLKTFFELKEMYEFHLLNEKGNALKEKTEMPFITLRNIDRMFIRTVAGLNRSIERKYKNAGKGVSVKIWDDHTGEWVSGKKHYKTIRMP